MVNQMKILVVGSGAREHAIVKALHRSPQIPQIYCCGTSYNPGIQALTTDYWVGDICHIEEVVRVASNWHIDMAIIGPEAPLEQGLSDILWRHNIPVVGPKKQLAQIETSKSYARNLLKKYNAPGLPEYRVFHDLYEVKEFLHHLGEDRYVIKADGLMGGKGVKVAGDHLHSFAEAIAYCQTLQEQNCPFVIEEKLIGQEFSFLCFSDGNRLVPMPLVQDHKRAFVGDKGPNTGGMGSYSDVNHRLPFLTDKDIETARLINESVVTALTAEYRERYIGILYGGFIATQKGVYLIEFNARFGDPEALNVLAILESDLVTICESMITGTLTPPLVQFANLATVCKYAVPNGYPDAPVKNVAIDISRVENTDQLYLAAVNLAGGKLFATGSRAVAVVGIGKTLDEAEKIAETEINLVRGPLFHRPDVGTQLLINNRIQFMKELRQ
jgi:phosphoribosylamine--glycine ligase